MHKGSAFRNTKLSTLIISPLSLSTSHSAALAGMFETIKKSRISLSQIALQLATTRYEVIPCAKKKKSCGVSVVIA
jgi:GTP-sensing pleiotropic transcriptional regulator CodY